MKPKKCFWCCGKGKIVCEPAWDNTIVELRTVPCYECGSQGVITEDRFNYLVNVEFPKWVQRGIWPDEFRKSFTADLIAWWQGSAAPPHVGNSVWTDRKSRPVRRALIEDLEDDDLLTI